MAAFNFKKLIGKQIFVQFRPGVALQLAMRHPSGEIDAVAVDRRGEVVKVPPTDAFPFTVGELNGDVAFFYDNPSNRTERMVLVYMPLELVAFVTTVDNSEAAEVTPPTDED